MGRSAPRLANFILDLLAPHNEALRGDLEEEFAAGRDRAWYWRQVIAAVGLQGALAVRARGLVAAENFVTGLITLLLVAFYAAFIVNVTDWLLRFEGVRVLARLPDMLGPFNGLAPLLTLVVGIACGRAIARGHHGHRVASVVAFGAATMLCAAVALKAVAMVTGSEVFLPGFISQVAATGAFVIGLVGSVAAVGMRPPLVLLGIGGRRPV
jgi:hypothetical protein